MEPKFQTSFIPKKPIVTDMGGNSTAGVVHETNIFSLVSTIVFAVTVLVSLGLFGYKIILNKQIAQADTDINTARAAFQVDKIKELIDANDRIVSSKLLLEKHVNVSKLLYLFQDLTVKRIRLLKLVYSNKSGVPTVELNGESLSYNALADQSNIFAQNAYLKNNQFSNFTPQENGNIKVDFMSTVDTSLLSYKKAIEALSTPATTETTNQ
jgi:hypothetical protein